MQQTDRQDMMIQSGRLDCYIPLKYEIESTFEELEQDIEDRIKNRRDDSAAHEQVLIQAALDAWKQKGEYENFNVTMEGVPESSFEKEKTESTTLRSPNGNGRMVLAVSENKLTIQIIKEEWAEYERRCEELKNENKMCEHMYGTTFVSYQNRFVLPPIKATLCNKESVWLNATLILFRNMMGILKLELPLKNVSAQSLKRNRPLEYIESLEDNWGFLNDNTVCDFETLGKQYIDYFLVGCEKRGIVQSGTFYNIILFEFDGKPKEINNIKSEVQDELYQIIAAPVSDIGCASIKKIALRYLEQHSWGERGIRCILSTTGNCLSIIDEEVTTWLRDCNQEEPEEWDADWDSNRVIESVVIQSMCTNVEAAIIILLLKKINATYTYSGKQSGVYSADLIQREYNKNVMYIAEIQEHCMGTASEQIEKFRTLMPYYLKESLVSEKMQALDGIIKDDKQSRETRFQTFISVAGLVVALVFGLPALEETLGILRTACAFVERDIPLFTVQNVSCGIWFAAIIVLIILFVRYMGKTYNWKMCRQKHRTEKSKTKTM